MPIDACGKATLGLGMLVLVVAALSGCWELLALQSPGTPLYIGMLPGPIGALRELSTTLGVLALIAAPWMRAAGGRRVPARALVVALYVGSALGLCAQGYGALHGMFGSQVVDMRPDALPVFVARQAGLALFGLTLVELARRVLRGPDRGDNLDQAGHNPPS